MRAEGRRSVRRERVGRGDAVGMGDTGREVGCGWMEGEVGAKRSDMKPVRRRAMVEVRAIIVTWVEGRPAGGGVSGGVDGGVSV